MRQAVLSAAKGPLWRSCRQFAVCQNAVLFEQRPHVGPPTAEVNERFECIAAAAPSQDGIPAFGPAGGGVWSAPTIDAKRRLVYVATGNGYAEPAQPTTDAVLAQLDQLADQYPSLLFIATSNFQEAIDQAFLSRADLVETIGLPTPDACERILSDTVLAIAEVHPNLKQIVNDPAFRTAAKNCVGLDARRALSTSPHGIAAKPPDRGTLRLLTPPP